MQEEKPKRRMPKWLRNGLLNKPEKHHGMKEEKVMGGMMSVLNPVERKKKVEDKKTFADKSDKKEPFWFLCAKAIADRKGFIIIIGLSIVALTSYYSIMVQKQMINTVYEIKNMNNLMQAEATTFSIGESMRYIVDHHEAGFSLKEVTCTYKDGKVQGESTNQLCADGGDLQEVAGWQKGKDVKLIISVEGRAGVNNPPAYAEKYTAQVCVGNMGACYGVPLPGNGNAGNETLCKQYKGELKGKSEVEDIDNECNWNKLTFGSSLTDRVAIPLYHDKAEFPTTMKNIEKSKPEIVNTFGEGGFGKNFILRVRTPCLPCYSKNPKTGEEIEEIGKRTCVGVDNYDKPRSPYYCTDDERYVLNTEEKDGTPDDMVVSWQITGLCEDNGDGKFDNECGMIPYKGKGSLDPGFSAIIESFINNSFSKYVVIDTTINDAKFKPKAKNTSDYSGEPPKIIDYLKKMTKPVFSMFLSGKLISDKGAYVPYLEYQFLTNEPTGQAKIMINILAIIENISNTRTLEKAEKRPLVDFAIQN